MSRKGREEREKGKKKYVERRTMIVSSDLIARDPRVSSRFNFSEKKRIHPVLSPRWPSDYAIGRERAAFTTGGEGREGEESGSARSFSDSIRDEATLAH